jgi:hypothetical protein
MSDTPPSPKPLLRNRMPSKPPPGIFAIELRESTKPSYMRAAKKRIGSLRKGLVSRRPLARILGVGPTVTTTVEIDRELLERLRERHPEKSDRKLLESVARIQLGHEASERAKERFAGVSSEEIEREAVEAVREVRRERAAARRTAG